jgi:hypothetical protein
MFGIRAKAVRAPLQGERMPVRSVRFECRESTGFGQVAEAVAAAFAGVVLEVQKLPTRLALNRYSPDRRPVGVLSGAE